MYIMCSWTSSLVSLLFCLLPPLVWLGPALVLSFLPGEGSRRLPQGEGLPQVRTRLKGAGDFFAGEPRAGGRWAPARAGPDP